MANCTRCGKFSYFANIVLCGTCNAKQAKVERLTKRYARLKAEGKFSLRWAVLDVFFRNGPLTINETAKILAIDKQSVRFEIDMIRQDAR